MRREWFLIAAMLAAGCAGRSGPPGPAAPVFDHAILPGKRVGPIALGITAAELERIAGRASSTTPGDGQVEYRYDGYSAVVFDRTQRVASIVVTSSRYALLSGLSVGDTEGAVIEQLGAPCNPDPVPTRQPHSQRYEFRGVNVVVDERGAVSSFEVIGYKGC
jgi:hypothetical protein